MDRVLKNNILASEVAADIAMTTTAGGKAMTQKMRVASRGAGRMKVEPLDGLGTAMAVKDDELQLRDQVGNLVRKTLGTENRPAFMASGAAMPSLSDYRTSFDIRLDSQASDPSAPRWVLEWLPTTEPRPFGRMLLTVNGTSWRIEASAVYDEKGSLIADSRMSDFVQVDGRWFATKVSTWVHTPQGTSKLDLTYSNVQPTKNWPDSAFELR